MRVAAATPQTVAIRTRWTCSRDVGPRALRHVEDMVLKAGGAVLRYGAFYGQGAIDGQVELSNPTSSGMWAPWGMAGWSCAKRSKLAEDDWIACKCWPE